mmetsp:Transcript_18534/g.55358  ORF Transcript_18534/g.55358 Transcript_18534/m.55358 type:complete len:231 (+) Transcript_18534:293-985(+)
MFSLTLDPAMSASKFSAPSLPDIPCAASKVSTIWSTRSFRGRVWLPPHPKIVGWPFKSEPTTRTSQPRRQRFARRAGRRRTRSSTACTSIDVACAWSPFAALTMRRALDLSIKSYSGQPSRMSSITSAGNLPAARRSCHLARALSSTSQAARSVELALRRRLVTATRTAVLALRHRAEPLFCLHTSPLRSFCSTLELRMNCCSEIRSGILPSIASRGVSPPEGVSSMRHE